MTFLLVCKLLMHIWGTCKDGGRLTPRHNAACASCAQAQPNLPMAAPPMAVLTCHTALHPAWADIDHQPVQELFACSWLIQSMLLPFPLPTCSAWCSCATTQAFEVHACVREQELACALALALLLACLLRLWCACRLSQPSVSGRTQTSPPQRALMLLPCSRMLRSPQRTTLLSSSQLLVRSTCMRPLPSGAKCRSVRPPSAVPPPPTPPPL